MNFFNKSNVVENNLEKQFWKTRTSMQTKIMNLFYSNVTY